MADWDVAAITVTYNGADVWDPFLACMQAQRGLRWHLFVIDNASSDATRERLALIDDRRVTIILNDTNVGVAAANNQGIVGALDKGARRIVLINNDTEFDPDLFNRLDAEMTRLDAAAISPLIPYFDAPDRIWYAGGTFGQARGIRHFHDHYDEPVATIGDEPFRSDYAPTCCVMFDRRVFDRIGLMDERYFVYWDDVDFMWRMKLANLRLIVHPGITLLHKVSVSTGGGHSDFSIRYYFRNQMLFARKFHGPLWAAYSAAVAAVIGVGRLVLRKDTRLRHFQLRLRALREGLKMSLAR